MGFLLINAFMWKIDIVYKFENYLKVVMMKRRRSCITTHDAFFENFAMNRDFVASELLIVLQWRIPHFCDAEGEMHQPRNEPISFFWPNHLEKK